MPTGILDILVLYLCFGLLSYLAFALGKFLHQGGRKFALNVHSQGTTQPRPQGLLLDEEQPGFSDKVGVFNQSICPSRVGVC